MTQEQVVRTYRTETRSARKYGLINDTQVGYHQIWRTRGGFLVRTSSRPITYQEYLDSGSRHPVLLDKPMDGELMIWAARLGSTQVAVYYGAGHYFPDHTESDWDLVEFVKAGRTLKDLM